MIVKVEQTQSNGKTRFAVKINEEVKYLAGTPWMDISLPMGGEKFIPCVFTAPDDSICFSASYNPSGTIAASANWDISGIQKVKLYNVMDSEGTAVAKIYKRVKGTSDAKYFIEYGDYALLCYDVSVGRTRNLLIYNGDVQIAEIVKPLQVTDNLDSYYIFLLDEHSELQAILSFFAVLFDYWCYSHKGEVVAKKKEVKVEYVYDKASKFYDKNWKADHFGKEKVDAFYDGLTQERKKIKTSIKKQTKILFLIFAAVWVILLTVCGFIFLPQYCV